MPTGSPARRTECRDHRGRELRHAHCRACLRRQSDEIDLGVDLAQVRRLDGGPAEARKTGKPQPGNSATNSGAIRFQGGTSTGRKAAAKASRRQRVPARMSARRSAGAIRPPSSIFFSPARAWSACAMPCWSTAAPGQALIASTVRLSSQAGTTASASGARRACGQRQQTVQARVIAAGIVVAPPDRGRHGQRVERVAQCPLRAGHGSISRTRAAVRAAPSKRRRPGSGGGSSRARSIAAASACGRQGALGQMLGQAQLGQARGTPRLLVLAAGGEGDQDHARTAGQPLGHGVVARLRRPRPGRRP